MARLTVRALVLAVVTAGPVAAQGLDGLYYQSGNTLTQMRCDPAFLHADGGPNRISGRTFTTVEGNCTLTGIQNEGSSLRATLRCMSEGMAFDRPVRLTGTTSGFRLDDLGSGYSTEYIRC